MEEPTKPARVRKGLPKGILTHRTGKYQARIHQIGEKGKPRQIDKPIPGLYVTADEAVAAQQAAQANFDAGVSIWPAEAKPRNTRGQVCAAP